MAVSLELMYDCFTLELLYSCYIEVGVWLLHWGWFVAATLGQVYGSVTLGLVNDCVM